MTRRVLRISGIALIIGAVAVPFAYLQWQEHQDELQAAKQESAADTVKLEDPTISVSGSADPAPKTSSDQASQQFARAIATLKISRFGSTWKRIVYEGTSVSKVLTPLGVGHYSFSAAPGQIGNFALAAHRAGSGGPFRNIDTLRAGDIAVVETASMRYTYRYLQSRVVEPEDVGVLANPPVGLTALRTSEAILTLTSCTPIHVNTQRFVVWFELIESAAL